METLCKFFSGFINGFGEANCFLNAALQILVNLKEFCPRILMKKSYDKNSFHHMLFSIIFKYKKSQASDIDISDIRQALAKITSAQGLFELYMPADSTEALIEILNIIHLEHVLFEGSCEDLCPSHQVFGIKVEELFECKCGGKKIQKWDNETFSHHIYVNEVFVDEKLTAERVSLIRFEEIEDHIEEFSVIDCEGKLVSLIEKECFADFPFCAGGNDLCLFKESKKTSSLLMPPRVYFIHFIWDNSRPSLVNLLQFLSSVPVSLDISLIFRNSQKIEYQVNCMIAYGMGHYIALVHRKGTWVAMDDIKITKIGNWKDLMIHLLRVRFYPVSIFFSIEDEPYPQQMTLKDWVELEYHAVSIQSPSKIQNKKSSEIWVCECGADNYCNNFSCSLCKKIKTGIEGWICSFCTYVNPLSQSCCEMCFNKKTDLIETKKKPKQSINDMFKRTTKKEINQRIEKNQRKEKVCQLCDEKINENLKICIFCRIKSEKDRCWLCSNVMISELCDECINFVKFCRCGKLISVVLDKCLGCPY